jgi:LPXTG-motif cell wall-anchored protein
MKRILSAVAALTLVMAMSATAQTQTYPEQTQPQQTQPGTTTDQQQQDQQRLEQQRMDQTQSTTTTETQTGTTDMTDDQNLPATASPLPLIGLAGLAALGVGVLLRRRR